MEKELQNTNENTPIEKEDTNEVELIENEIYTLTDEEGKESEFQLIAKEEFDGEFYLALIPLQDNEDGCYVILKMVKNDNGEVDYISIEDDDEFDRVADFFDDKLIPEIDYDGEEEEKK